MELPAAGQPPTVLRIDAFTKGEYDAKTVARSPAAMVYEGPFEEAGTALLKLADGQVLAGYSGAPVLDTRGGGVCAMVDSSRDPGSNLGGFGVPVSAFAEELDGLLERNVAFHQHDQRWQRAVEKQDEQAARLAGLHDRLPLLANQVELASEVGDRQSDLLRPRHRVVPIVGRERFMSRLGLWREADSAMEVAFLTGGGGFGKTRLAVEACIAAEQAGWTAGLLDGDAARDYPDRISQLSEWPGRLFVAIDYAETRPEVARELLRELQRRPRRPPARVVLVCRQALERRELEALFGGGTATEELGALLAHAEPFRLPAEDLDRHTLFSSAARAFAEHLSNGTAVSTRASLRAEHYARPLFVSGAALLACQDPDVDIDGLDEEQLMLELIDRHETRYWQQTADGRQLVLDPDLQRSAIAVATLVGAHDEREALALVNIVPGLADATDERKRAIGTWLSSLYGPGDLSASPAIVALDPDPLAEALIARELRARPELIATVLDLQSDRQVSQALAVFMRVSERRTDLSTEIRATLDERLSALVARAVEARAEGQDLLAALTTAALALRPAAGAARTDLSFGTYGHGFLHLARLLADLAVGYNRQRVTVDRERFLPDLAGSLNNQSSLLAEAGRPAEGLAPIEEAVEHYKPLAEADPQRFLPAVAMSLNNQSNLFADVGRPVEGLAPIEEAVEHYRALAEADPQRFLPDLAGSLNNQANRLADVGRPVEGLAPIEEAVEHYRALAEADPQRFLPDLAMSLNNQSGLLAEAGRPADGLAPIEEAVRYRRALAEADPQRFLPDLAGSLNNQANLFAGVGRPVEGLAPIEEAVQHYRALAEADPQRFLPDLATSLNDQSNRFADVGRPADGLAPIEGALAAMEGEWALGVLLGVRAWHHRRTDNVGAAVRDAWRAFGLLDHGDDPFQRGRIRRFLRGMRSSDAEGFDAAWATVEITSDQPIWLQHPATEEDVQRVVTAWINTSTWAESEHMLAEETAALFDDHALAAIEHLIDGYPGDENLMSHLALLAHARAHGVHAAYTQLRRELAHAELIQITTAWLQAQSHASELRLAREHGDVLFSIDAERLIAQIADENPAEPWVLGRVATLTLARLDGPQSALSIDGLPTLDPETAASDPSERNLAYARLAVTEMPTAPDAHLTHAILAGATQREREMQHAVERLKRSTNTWERSEYARRLSNLETLHPTLASSFAAIREALTNDHRSADG